jgi:hypothetical protein
MNIMSNNNFYRPKFKVAAVGIVLSALLSVPSPLLPPHLLGEAIQSMLGVNWKMAYLAAAVGLQAVFYCSVGMISAFTVKRAQTFSGRLLQIVVLPVVVVGVALVIRSVKMGHLPVWVNGAIPTVACMFGVWLGLGLLYQRWKATAFIVVTVIGVTLWVLLGGATTELSRATEGHLRRLVAAGSGIPSGEARFGALLQVAFAPISGESEGVSSVQHNRAAILALGLALGDERLAQFVGLNRNSQLMHEGALLRQGTTLRDRDDWSRHFCLSAALAVLEHPLVSDASGLMKEQVDALTGGSGFSFGDLAADLAGVRFAISATHSEAAGKAMQDLLRTGFEVDKFFPPAADLPENLTTEQFRREYGSVGSERYRQKVSEIENRLMHCVALSPPPSRQ